MAQRILILENEQGFAQELVAGFEKLGVIVDVVNDGPTGLGRASEINPDLILLTIELPGMNGFLVCKKIKKTESLKDIPLIILSSEASSETFEQHSKLRTHAQLYLHKPISFNELLENIQKLMVIGSTESDEDLEEVEEVLEVEDEMIVISDNGLSSDDIIAEEATYIVDDAEKFANDTFESLMVKNKEPQQEIDEVMVSSALDFSDAASSEFLEEQPKPADFLQSKASEPTDLGLLDESESTSGPQVESVQEQQIISEGDSELSLETSADSTETIKLRSELENAQMQIADLQKALQSNEAATYSTSSGVSSREFLDLKERLNRKDRELLDLRDQVSSRDKQLLESRDENLTIARDLADIKDANILLERDINKNRELVATLTADKASAKKRNEDLKARLERIEFKARELETELDTSEKNASEKIAILESEHRTRLDDAQKVHEEEMRSLREELEEKYTAEIKSNEDKHSRELAVVVRSISEVESKLAEVEEKLQQVEDDKKGLRESLDSVIHERDTLAVELSTTKETYHKLEGTKKEQDERIESLLKRFELISEKMANDKELLDRVYRAMAIGIGLLEEQKQNQMEF